MDGPIAAYTGIVFRKGRSVKGGEGQEPPIDADRPKVRESPTRQMRKSFANYTTRPV